MKFGEPTDENCTHWVITEYLIVDQLACQLRMVIGAEAGIEVVEILRGDLTWAGHEGDLDLRSRMMKNTRYTNCSMTSDGHQLLKV